MTEIRYCDQTLSTPARVTAIGTQPGPPTGDGWTLVGQLRQSTMPAGAGAYAIVVSGTIGDTNIGPSGMANGVLQVCLGTAGGTKHPDFRIAHSVTHHLGPKQGIPFQFLVLIHPSFPDSLFGSSFNPATTQLCCYARTYMNGDAVTYISEFTVANLTWQWWDLTNIPAGHWAADQVVSLVAPIIVPTAVPTSFLRVAPTPWGGDGETWLHFANVWYEQRGAGAHAPMFRFGVTPDGTYGALVTKVGSQGRWGMSRNTSLLLGEKQQLQQGAFWPHVNSGAGSKPGYSVYELLGSVQSQVFRYQAFGVRIDTLPDVIVASSGIEPAGLPESGAWETEYVTQERPAAGILTEPIVMAHQVPQSAPAFGAYGTRITEAGSGQSYRIGVAEGFAVADPSRGEAVSAVAFGRRVFQTTSPAMQYRVHMVGDAASPTALQLALDYHFVQFHPVRDPENLTTPPGSLPPPIIVVPGKQAADAASLPPPPHLPNSKPSQTPDGPAREAITGATGYRRTWPLGAKVLTRYSLTWGPMSEADGIEVYTFLRANAAWRYTPPRGAAALAVLNATEATLVPAGHRTCTVSVDVVVLAFTGA